ncbi:MAG: SpoIIIAH-like family protein [Oscillospiraceae bacterium]|nr:SpoIIIAH-like family protein [Oscillospiraceae bacterium]
MKIWKRNAVVVAIVLFVCVAVYLNWSYQEENNTSDVGKTLGQSTLVSATTDPLLTSPEETGAEKTMLEGDVDAADEAIADESGSTVLTASQSDYFATARLNRQQARSSALSILQQSTEGEDVSTQTVQDTNTAIQTIASYTVSEAQIENLVTAKGYAECVAFIGDNSVSVVVAASGSGLNDADVARITEIVTEETGFAANQVKIIEAE